jgi:hypothetical protein
MARRQRLTRKMTRSRSNRARSVTKSRNTPEHLAMLLPLPEDKRAQPSPGKPM